MRYENYETYQWQYKQTIVAPKSRGLLAVILVLQAGEAVRVGASQNQEKTFY